MSGRNRRLGIGAAALAAGLALALAWWWLGAAVPGPGPGTPAAPLLPSSGGDTGATPADAPAPPVPDPGPFDPLSVPDWFDSRLQFSHARLQPLRGESGEPLGIRVISVHPALRPARLDVRPGDLLLRINGVSLTDPVHFERAVDIVGWTFLRADLVTVKIRRAGEEFSLAELGRIDTAPTGE